MPRRPDIQAALDAGVAGGEECVLWPGNKDQRNYGMVQVEGRSIRAHVYVYILRHGEVPPGHQVDHTCHDPETCKAGNRCPHRLCCNGDHLEAVTQRENIRRGRSAQREKTHCPSNHEYTPENTRMFGNRRGCKTCHRERERARRLAKSQ